MSRIVERFEQVCRDNRDVTAVVYRSGDRVCRRTFSELHSDVHSMRAYLVSCGVKQGDRMLAFASSSYKLCVFMLAALEIGASIMYVDIWAKQESLHSVFEDYKPDMLLVSDKTKHIRVFFREINKVKRIINIDKAEDFSAVACHAKYKFLTPKTQKPREFKNCPRFFFCPLKPLNKAISKVFTIRFQRKAHLC